MRVVDVTSVDGDQLALDFTMTQSYRHTFGSVGPFFEGLGENVLRATRCAHCQASFMPPRSHCTTDHSETVWYDLPGTGTVAAATRVHSSPPFGGIEAPYVLAIIDLDGVDGALTHQVLADSLPPTGTRVQVTSSPVVDGPGYGDKVELIHPLLQVVFTIVEEDR